MLFPGLSTVCGSEAVAERDPGSVGSSEERPDVAEVTAGGRELRNGREVRVGQDAATRDVNS
jgi:hypothetical protein